MIVAARINDEDFRVEGVEEIVVAGVEIAVVVGFHCRHLAADGAHKGFEVALLARVYIVIAAGEVSAVVVTEFAVAETYGAGVHILVEEHRVAGVHFRASASLSRPQLAVRAEVAYLEAGFRFPGIFHTELFVRSDLELLHTHSLSPLIFNEFEIFFHKTLVRGQDFSL